MGSIEVKDKIWNAITANDSVTLQAVLKKYPEYINKPITSDKKTNAITRAAYLDRPHILSVLYSLGADLNLPADSKITGLMWAAAKGNINSVEFLLKCGADSELKGPYDMKAVDFAVLFGSYTTAFYLHEKGSEPSKTCEEFGRIKEKMKTPLIDFGRLLNCLSCAVLPNLAPVFASGALEVRESGLRDPNETWGSWVSRISDSDALKVPNNRAAASERPVTTQNRQALTQSPEVRSDLQEEDLD